ncbi:hypothetical protein F5883DRAFT_697485, partial [Diaporthe sp. PMI_573]
MLMTIATMVVTRGLDVMSTSTPCTCHVMLCGIDRSLAVEKAMKAGGEDRDKLRALRNVLIKKISWPGTKVHWTAMAIRMTMGRMRKRTRVRMRAMKAAAAVAEATAAVAAAVAAVAGGTQHVGRGVGIVFASGHRGNGVDLP